MSLRAGLLLLSLSAFAAVGCDDEHLCPSVFVFDAFNLIFDDPEWSPAEYTIDVSYEVGAESHDYSCAVRVPAFGADAAAEDAGAATPTPGGRGQNAPRQYISCSPQDSNLSAQVGRAIVLTFNESPKLVHVRLQNAGATVLERDLALEYETQHPFGKFCQDRLAATQRIQL